MRLDPYFTDGMVLQAGKPVLVKGSGNGHLCAELLGERVEADVTGDAWTVGLPAMPYGGPYEMRLVLDGRESVIRDVWIGDVYLLGGQSNMQFKLSESDFGEHEAYTDHPLVRLFSQERPEEGEPFSPKDGWVACTAENAGDFPCIGYIVADRLARRRTTAIGLVTCYQGAAAIQCFLPPESFADGRFVFPVAERYDAEYPWNRENASLYASMVRTLMPLSFAAVIWYQGESNASPGESALYFEMLRELVLRWREGFLDPGLRFILVQIADYIPRRGPAWDRIREAQLRAARELPLVQTVTCSDVCENDLIHPRRKTVLSERIAALL